MKAMLVLLLCVLSISLPASGRILQASSAAPSAVNFVTALKSAKTKADLSGLIKALEATGRRGDECCCCTWGRAQLAG